jgi:hypothetical protein
MEPFLEFDVADHRERWLRRPSKRTSVSRGARRGVGVGVLDRCESAGEQRRDVVS